MKPKKDGPFSEIFLIVINLLIISILFFSLYSFMTAKSGSPKKIKKAREQTSISSMSGNVPFEESHPEDSPLFQVILRI